MDLTYQHVASYVQNTLWAVTPELRNVMVELLALRMSGDRLSRPEIEARIGAPQPAPARNIRAGNVAIIPISGMITQRAGLFSDVSGMTSLDKVSVELSEALADSSVDTIALHINSPGGSTDGVSEMAARIRAAREQKPVVAVADAMAASAAYWLGSQATEFVATPSGDVGSIGIYTVHRDLSGALEKEGVNVTVISEGPFKTEGTPFGPLSEEAEAAIQERVSDMYDMFVADVAAGRGVSIDAVRNGFGQGRIVNASRALAAGMVDAVEPFDAVLARLRKEDKPPPIPPRRRSPASRALTRKARHSAGLLMSSLPRKCG